MIPRRLLLCLLLWSISVTADGASPPGPDLSCAHCDLVFLNLDFLRADYVGPGGDSGLTPHIERFFRDGIHFSRAHATSGSTYRGNLSVFNATSPHYFPIDVRSFERLGGNATRQTWERIFAAPQSIAQILQREGFRTVAINKGGRSGSATQLDRGFDDYRDFPMRTLFRDLVDESIRTLGQRTGRTFFHLHGIPTRLHKAYYPADRQRLEHENIIYRPYQIDSRPYGFTVVSRKSTSVEERRAAEHAIYRQQLQYADDEIARLFRTLEQWVDSSLIVLFSTHGTQLGDHGIFASDGVSYQPNILVPMMIRHPKVDRPIRIDSAVSMQDLVATILDMLGIPATLNDSRSLVPLIQGGAPPRDALIGRNDGDAFVIQGDFKLLAHLKCDARMFRLDSGSIEPGNRYLLDRSHAAMLEYRDPLDVGRDRVVRDDQFELQLRHDEEYELFDIRHDPDETTNLAQQHPEITRRLAGLLAQSIESARAVLARVLE